MRNPPSDPAVRRRMLHSTGLDPHVRDYLRATPGFETIVQRGLDHALAVPGRRHRVDIHVACGGGRPRSVVVAEELAARLQAAGIGAETEHRHIDRPILT
ncbi:RapZ C-terminal domain-containing protein [Streptomyces rubiginosohelvolus]